MDEEKVRELADRENWRGKRKVAAAVFLVSVAVFTGAVALRSSPTDIISQGSNDTGDEPELTKYQQSYVDCPAKYLPLCTKMSKIPTEPVKFQKVENGRLYLSLPRSGRTLVANIQDGGQDGYLVSING